MPLNGDIFNQVQQLLGSVSTEEAEAQIARLKQEIEERQGEQQRWYSLLALKSQLGELPVQNGSTERPPLRVAIKVALRDHGIGAVISLATLRDELLRRGWLGDTDNEYHRLQMQASNMVRRSELDRPKKGFYRLVSDDTGPSEEAQNSGPGGARAAIQPHRQTPGPGTLDATGASNTPSLLEGR